MIHTDALVVILKLNGGFASTCIVMYVPPAEIGPHTVHNATTTIAEIANFMTIGTFPPILTCQNIRLFKSFYTDDA